MAPHQVTHARDLMERGYVEVTAWGDFAVGDRVHHIGQQWGAAEDNGTATIERIFHKPESAWALKYNAPDVEIIVKRDEPQWGSDYGYWANYHTVKVNR